MQFHFASVINYSICCWSEAKGVQDCSICCISDHVQLHSFANNSIRIFIAVWHSERPLVVLVEECLGAVDTFLKA